MGMADIHAQRLPGVCSHILPWQLAHGCCLPPSAAPHHDAGQGAQDCKELGGMWPAESSAKHQGRYPD